MKDDAATILIVDDEAHDIEFLERALKRSGRNLQVRSAVNGEEAVAYLRGEGKFADRVNFPFPRVIITDLKMPQMDGLELLQWIHGHEKCRLVPTVVFTSSTSEADVTAAFAFGARGYLVKPVSFAELERMVKTVADYWRLSLVPKV